MPTQPLPMIASKICQVGFCFMGQNGSQCIPAGWCCCFDSLEGSSGEDTIKEFVFGCYYNKQLQIHFKYHLYICKTPGLLGRDWFSRSISMQVTSGEL